MDSCIDLTVVPTKDTAFALSNKGKLYRVSTLAMSGTWTEITSPNKHAAATGRPYGLGYMTFAAGGTDYLFCCEYTSTQGDINGLSDGRWPAVHRYNLATNTWVVSGYFPQTKHIHSLLVWLNNALYVSTGDALLPDNVTPGTGVGIYRLVASGVGVANGGAADTWVRVTGSLAQGYNANYCVDMLRLLAAFGRQAGIYGASDRPGKHLMHVKQAGTLGKFNLNSRLFQQNGLAGETVRSIVEDPATGNIYYFTSETADYALYVSPPPYTQTFKLYSFGGAISIMRSVISNGKLLCHQHVFDLIKFEGQ